MDLKNLFAGTLLNCKNWEYLNLNILKDDVRSKSVLLSPHNRHHMNSFNGATYHNREKFMEIWDRRGGHDGGNKT